jgi:hypothetical protein
MNTVTDRFAVFKPKERAVLEDALIELYNWTPGNHRRKLKIIEDLLAEINPENTH